jgi:ribonuclease E
MLESELYDREFDNDGKSGRGAGEVAGPAVPAAVFQPPQVVFQPPPSPTVRPEADEPASGSPRTRTTAADRAARDGAGRDGAGRGSRGGAATRSAAAPEPSANGATSADDPADADGGDGADGAEGRRRRRRPSRSRASAGSGPDDAAADGSEGAAAADEATDSGASGGTEDDNGRPATRRTRTRRTSAAAQESAAAESAEAEAAGSDDDADDEDGDGGELAGSPTARRRRRKRRRGSAEPGELLTSDDPPDTVVHVREPVAADDVRAVRGSTRLEAKKQRRREGRETGRRRPPIITESEFLARREAVERTMVVRQRDDRTQIAVLEDGVLVEHYVNRSTQQSYVGNVYLGKVQNVLPSMEAAFVDIGKGRNAVLYAGEVNFDVSGLEGQPKRIESALKAGQSLIVQVTKDPVGHKGARLTSQVSLPGRYLVYVPGASMTGISRKLPDTERNRLKAILKKVMPENAGVIVRTAAEGAAEEELARDVSRLAAQWEAIEKKSKSASAPAQLYGEPDLTIRVIRDVFNEDFAKLMVAGDQGWDTVDEYVRYVAPHLADRLSRWEPESADDVFAAYRIDEQLAKALDRKVWLPSGGSLVIDKTEAMTVIDVNTGKFTGQGGNLEETVTRNNLEAAEEIVRQLRLRDVGGIVVIDFIDMVLESNRELVLRRMLECLARDRTKHQVAEVTSLGLVQMTRKRVGAGLLEAFSQPCECCNGRGVLLTYETDADGRATGHVHPRPTDVAPNGGSGGNGSRGSGGSGSHGSAGHGSGGHGSGSAGSGSAGSGSAGSGSASSGSQSSGGHGNGQGNGNANGRNGGGNGNAGGGNGGRAAGSGRSRRGSRGRGSAQATDNGQETSAATTPSAAAIAVATVAAATVSAAQHQETGHEEATRSSASATDTHEPRHDAGHESSHEVGYEPRHDTGHDLGHAPGAEAALVPAPAESAPAAAATTAAASGTTAAAAGTTAAASGSVPAAAGSASPAGEADAQSDGPPARTASRRRRRKPASASDSPADSAAVSGVTEPAAHEAPPPSGENGTV